MKIKFVRPHTIGNREYKAGSVLDLPNDKVEKLKKLGVVVVMKAVKEVRPSSSDSGSAGEGESLEANPGGSGKKKKRIY